MYQPTLITWVLIVFGLITCLPLLFAQLVILTQPKGQKAKDILIGKGEEFTERLLASNCFVQREIVSRVFNGGGGDR